MEPKRVSEHYKDKRHDREELINECIKGDGKVIDSFIVDRGHSKGIERHEITENGIILIYNNQTNKLVTKLIARPWQIKRYYRGIDREPPQWLMTLCEWHTYLNYNQ